MILDEATKRAATANITSNSSLVNRLDLNQRYGRFDFHSWVMNAYAIQKGMDVLDVGCGNGAQALRAIETVGSEGSVSATDISSESVAQLAKNGAAHRNLQTHVADMGELQATIRDTFRVKKYDFAHSTYALGYAPEPLKVLDAMRAALKPGARMAVTTPIDPNSLRELAKRVGRPVPKLDQIGQFPKTLLEPYFRSYFYKVTIHLQKNIIQIPSVEEVLSFFRSTAYFDPAIENAVKEFALVEIRLNGFFRFEKNNYMILGDEQIEYP